MNSGHILLLVLSIWVLVALLGDLTDPKRKSTVDKLKESDNNLISRFK